MGDPAISSAISRQELPGDQLQASAAHSSAEERKNEWTRGTAKQWKQSAAGRAARHRAETVFSRDVVIGEYVRYYEEVVSAR